MRSEPSGNGRCSAFASDHGASSHVSHSAGRGQDHRHRLGMDRPDLGVGRRGQETEESARTGPSLTFRTEVQVAQMPAKNASGRLSSRANQTGGREPSGKVSFSAKLVNGTRQRCSVSRVSSQHRVRPQA